jgi:rhamnosyl/mannosyltransferase
MLLALAAMPRVRPLVITHHSDIVRQKVLRHAVTPFEHLIYRRSARILPTSDPYVEGSPLLRRYRAKVTAVPLGLDLAPYTNPSPEARAYSETAQAAFPGPIWLSVGRLIYYKALDVALRALLDVPGTLVVVGTGPMETAWRQLAVELGIADRVIWKGQTPDHELIGLYHAATALWFPSNARSEGYGLVQVEAMACGCPVINTAIPYSGVSWVSRDGQTGLTVPVNDPGAFAAAAKRLLAEPGLRANLSAEARRQAAERFDHRVMAKRTLDIYQAVTERSG